MKKILTILFIGISSLSFGQTQIKTTQINPTLPASLDLLNNGNRFSVSDSLYINVPTSFHTPSGTMTFLGTSITNGNGITTGGTRYSTQVANALGLTENNLGFSGLHIQQTGDGLGFQDKESLVPTYSGTLMIVETGPNDFNSYTGGGGTYQPSTYQTDLTTLINYLITTKGYPTNKILLLNNSYISFLYNDNGGSGIYTATKTAVVYNSYKAATLAVATAKGTGYFDTYSWFVNNGGDFLMKDALHTNNLGHTNQANGILTILKPTVVYKSAQNLAVNGNIEIAKLKFDNKLPFSDNAGANILGIDTNNNIGVLGILPSNVRTKDNIQLTGAIRNVGVPAAFSINAQDWVLGNQYIYGVQTGWGTGGGVYAYTQLQLCNSSAGYTFKTIYNSGSLALATFASPTQPTAFQIFQNGNITPAGDINMGTGNINLNFSSQTAIQTTAAGGLGRITPFANIGGTNGTFIDQSWSGGAIVFRTSRGSTGSFIEAARFAPSGNLLMNLTTDEGENLDVLNTSRFQGGIAIGRLPNPLSPGTPATSPTGGTLTAGTYWYSVVYVDNIGNLTNGSTPTLATITTGTTNTNTISWSNGTGATSYRIYTGSSSGSLTKYFTAPYGSASAVDIGSGYTTGVTPPTTNKTGYVNISSSGDAMFITQALNDNSNRAATTTYVDRISALHGNSTTTGTATTAVTVTIGSTMANTTYAVAISPKDLLTAVNYYISAQTTTTFTVTFVTALTGSINFDWILTP